MVRSNDGPVSGGGAGGNSGGSSPDGEHWSEAVRRRVRAAGERRARADEDDPGAGSGDETAAGAGPLPSKGPDDPATAVRERVERRLRETGVPRDAAASPSVTPAGADGPAASGSASPDPSPGAPGETTGETGTAAPADETPAPAPAERDWEEEAWEEAEAAGRAAGEPDHSLPGRLAAFLATCGFVGRLPPAPGTAGAVVGLGAWYLTADLTAPVGIAAFLAATVVGTWAARRYAASVGVEDPQEVVVDEFSGMWLALLGVAPSLPAALLAFAAFRVLDIAKPPPIRQLERLPGGFGIMADDLAAGAVARLLVFLVFGV